jgi:hypothetical protein
LPGALVGAVVALLVSRRRPALSPAAAAGGAALASLAGTALSFWTVWVWAS